MTIDFLRKVRELQGQRSPQRVKTITDVGGHPDENESAAAMAMEQPRSVRVAHARKRCADWARNKSIVMSDPLLSSASVIIT